MVLLYIFIIMYTCVVPGCKSVSQLLRFPRDKKLLKQWILVAGNPTLKKMRFGHIYKSKRICSDHFENDCFSEKSTIINKFLIPTAIPSLNLPEQPENISCRAHLYTYFMFDPHTTRVISKSFSKLLKEEALNLTTIDRNCILMFTTIPLRPELKYNSEFDMIMGWQNGNGKTDHIFAEQVMVFMIHGLYTNWKQLISFVFYEENIKPNILIQSIQDVLATCGALRFKVVATVCEENDSNINALTELKSITHTNCSHGPDDLGYESFLFDDREIIILYDVPNLLKNIRNEFMYNDIHFTTENIKYTAKWQEITKFVSENQQKISVLNLNENCLNPGKIKKNSTSQCMKIFSSELSSLMLNSVKKSKNIAIEGTAKFLQFFSEFFDSLNGVNNKSPINKPLHRTVTLGSKHWEAWSKNLEVLDSIKLLNCQGRKYQPSCVIKLKSTLYGIMHLWRGVLQRAKFKSFSPKYLQLRDLESDIFEIYRMKNEIGKQKKCLTPNEFVKSFNYIIVRFPDSRLPICDATRPLLLSMIKYLVDKNVTNEDCRNLDLAINSKCRTLLTEPDFDDFIYEPILWFENSQLLDENTLLLETFPVYIARKRIAEKLFDLMKSVNCISCNNILFQQNSIPISYVALLHSSNKNFAKAFRIVAVYVNRLLPQICGRPNIMTNLIVNINNELDLNFLDCGEHLLNKVFVELCVRYMILTWVWKLNRYLYGSETVFHQNMNKFAKQAILLGRKQKHLKNKQKGNVYIVKNKNRRFSV